MEVGIKKRMIWLELNHITKLMAHLASISLSSDNEDVWEWKGNICKSYLVSQLYDRLQDTIIGKEC